MSTGCRALLDTVLGGVSYRRTHPPQILRCGSARLSYPEVKWLLAVMAFGTYDLDLWRDRAGGVGIGEMILRVDI